MVPGTDRAKWSLAPQLARPEVVSPDNRLDYELGATKRFIRGARTRHERYPEVGDYCGWLFLMQHYGLPTRLLDWSESFLIAAFFAVFNYEHWDFDGAIWALNPGRLNAEFIGHETFNPIFTPHDPFGRLATQLAFVGENIGAMPPDQRKMATALQKAVVALEPEEVDIRMLMQQSMFTVHGVESFDFGQEFPREPLRKLVVPAAKKEEFAHLLAAAGIRQSTIFPDLEHLARELKEESRISSARAKELPVDHSF